jgi:hypothetical protein
MQLFQWGVIILFAVLHFALGYFRGAAKSGYFTLVNILLSFIILWIVSGVSVANSLPQADLIAQIEANLSGNVSAEVLSYLTRVEVINLLYGLVDVFVRIVTFLVLYTVVRWFLSFVGFGLLYKYVLEKHVQKVFKVEKVTFTTEKDKENDGAETIKDPVVHAKVIKKSTDRLIGGAFGAVRGFITAIFLLLPLVVLASTTNNLDFESNGDVLGETNLNEVIAPLQVTPVFAGLQNSLFDWAFETDLTESQVFNLRDELNNVTAIAQRAYDAGFLSENFDVNALGSEDAQAVKDILGLVGDSDVLIAFLEVGSDLAADGLLEELTGLELSDGAATQAALAELKSVDWKLELAALGLIFEKLTEVGSLEEIGALLEDTNNLASLTEAEVTALADVLRAVADLQLIKVANVGVEYVLELEDVQANIEWLPVAERETYLKEALAEVLNDTEFFYGENGDLYNLADLLEVVLADYGTFSVAQLLEEDPVDALLTEDGEDFLNATLDEVTQVELVSALLPTAVDFALYSAFDADVAAELDEALNDTVDNLDFDAEFDTFGQIFGALVTLTANELLAGNEEVIAFVDRVAQNNLPTVRLLVGYVFDDSVLVNAALNEAAPVLLDAFVEDQDTKDLLDTLLFDENGLTIDLGQELNTLLDVLEDVYGFATLQDVLDLTNGNADAVVFLDSVFADATEAAALRSALNTLLADSQLIEQVGNNFEAVLPYLVEDENTRTLLETLLTDNNGALALDLAAEVDTLLDVLEVAYGFTTLEGLLGTTEGLDLRGSANLGYAFGSLAPEDFAALVTAVKDLQLVGALNQENTESLLAFLGVENVYVPATFDAGLELEYVLNLVYGLSVYLHENMEPGLTPIEDVDFTELLLSDALAGLLLVQEGTPNSQLIVPNIAYSIETALIDAGLNETIIVPEVLLASSPESAAWVAEYNVLVTLLLTVAELASNYYELSVWGLEDLLSNTDGELVDTLAFADDILEPNMTALKQVVGGIVANSQILVATADNTLNNLVEPILGTPVNINVIQEIMTLLDVVEIGYEFTSLEGMYTISQDLSLENLAAAGIAFGSLSPESATTLVQKLTSLQLVSALDRSLMLEALNNLEAANIVVPQDFNAAYELSVILNLLYATSHYLHEETNEVLGVKGLDFGPLLTSAAFESFMVAEEGNTYSKMLVANFKQVMLMVEDMPALRLYFDVPASLEAQFAESAAWTAEYNRLIKFVIGFAGALNENIELSSNQITVFTNSSFRTLTLDVIDPFNDPVVFNQTFGVLDDSEIFRASAVKLFELGQLIAETVYGYELELPANVFENGALKNNALQALFKPLISILADVKDASGLEVVRDLFLQRTAEETLEFLGLLSAIDRDDIVLLGQSEIFNGLLSQFLTNPNNQSLFSTTILDLAANYAGIQNELITNIPFSTELFEINPAALDVNGNLNSNEIVIMFDLANALTTSTGLFEFNTLDDIYADGLLDGIFESDVFMSYASNALQNEALQAYAIDVVNDRQDVATVPNTFVELDEALLDANGYVLVSELEALADVMYVMGLMDIDTVRQMMADLMESPSIATALGLIRGYAVSEDFENQRLDAILNSNVVYSVIAQYLDNENLDDVLLPFLPEALADTFGNVDLGVPSDLKADEGLSVEYISRAELKALLTAITYIPVDPTALDGNVFNFITDLIGENVNPDTNEDDLDRFLASGYLREKLSRLFLSEAVLNLFGETPESFVLPQASYVVVDSQRRLTADELRNIVEAFAVLEITTIDELDFSFEVFTALTAEERETVLASDYLYAVVDGLIQNQQSVAIPQEVIAVTGEISQEEILAVIEAVELLNITDVTSLQTAITGLDVNDADDAALLQLLEDLDSGIVDSLLALLP